MPHSLAPGRVESARAFEAYRVYLELGPRRRYAVVARQVGASLRTVKRWAGDFDWRGRVRACAAQGVERYAEAQAARQAEEFVDAAARDRAFRDRQYAVAEAMLDAAERFLELLDDDDRDQMSFGDACKALEVATRVGREAAGRNLDAASESARGLRDQLAGLLDQACRETPPPTSSPQPSTPVRP